MSLPQFQYPFQTKANRQRLDGILKKFKHQRVLVIGDVGVDRYTMGAVERISPEAPVPIVRVEEEVLKLGLAANVADNVHVLGGAPELIGVIGKDRSGQDFKALLRSAGISPRSLVLDATRRTVVKERIVSDRQQLLRVDYESQHGVSKSVGKSLLAQIKKRLSKVDAVVLEDYAKGMLSAGLMQEIFSLARRAGKWVAVDPNAKTPVSWYRGASILTPNLKEAEKLSGTRICDEESLFSAGRKIMKATQADHVVVTRGKDGMAIFSAETRAVRLIPTWAREVYDVSGAGDTVIAVLALARAAGATLEDAAVLGNLAAGVEVGKRGTATVTPAEIRTAMDFFLEPEKNKMEKNAKK